MPGRAGYDIKGEIPDQAGYDLKGGETKKGRLVLSRPQIHIIVISKIRIRLVLTFLEQKFR